MKWKILIILNLGMTNITQQSIAGVTYLDDFDFEERYRNLHECDPFYWHPLHLPEHCAEMFEKLIRSRVATAVRAPVRIVRKRPKQINDIYSLHFDYYGYPQQELTYPTYDTESGYRYNFEDTGMYDDEQDQIMSYLPPYERMLELIRRDISKNPTAPVVAMSNYGPVAMYEQPISKQSEKIIKKIAHAYADAHIKEADDGYFYGKIVVPSDVKNNGTEQYKNENNIVDLNNNNKQKAMADKKHHRIGRKKTKGKKQIGLGIE